MQRTYEYKGFTLDVCVEADFRMPTPHHRSTSVGYVALVKILHDDAPLAALSPLRLGDSAGHPFGSEVEALMGGYSAARKIVDDLAAQDATAG